MTAQAMTGSRVNNYRYAIVATGLVRLSTALSYQAAGARLVIGRGLLHPLPMA